MKKLISTLFLLSIGSAIVHVHAQVDCDSIIVEQIRYNAVDQTLIEISAYALGFDCVSYPSFILFDQNGDTLANETANFFCLGLGSPQTHSLVVLPGAQIPASPFPGRLELYSGFGDSLVCSWDLSAIELCPPVGCQPAEIYITNTGELEAFEAYWSVFDEDGVLVDNGNFLVDDVTQTHFDTTCLFPGQYVLGFSPFSPIDEDYVIGITESYNRSIGTNTALDSSLSPYELDFTWYGACVDMTNAVPENRWDGTIISVLDRQLNLVQPEGPLGTIQLFSADGRLVRRVHVLSDRTTIDLYDLNPGLYSIRIIRSDNQFARNFILP